MKIRWALALAASVLAAPLHAATPVALANQVYVERASDGSRVLEPARDLRRGDKLVYIVSWTARQPRAESLTITNPLPRAVAYQRSASGREDVSVDGGRTWGKLDGLRIREGAAWRQATPEDVTHVRWQVPAQIALAGSGRVTWSGIVR